MRMGGVKGALFQRYVSIPEVGPTSIRHLWHILWICNKCLRWEYRQRWMWFTDSKVVVGEEKPILYLSRKLLPREYNYSTVDRECFAIKWAVESLPPRLRVCFCLLTKKNRLKLKQKHQTARSPCCVFGTKLDHDWAEVNWSISVSTWISLICWSIHYFMCFFIFNILFSQKWC